VAPCPTRRPSRTRTQPTVGLGVVRPARARARASARRMKWRSNSARAAARASGGRFTLFVARASFAGWSFLAKTNQIFELVHELVDILKRTVHRCEANVCDLIHAVEFVHDRGADFGARNFLGSTLGGVMFDTVGDFLDSLD